MSRHRILVRYKQSVLGLAWALIQPLSLMAIYTIIFSVVTRVPTSGTPYPIFVYSALLPWTFFSSAVSNSTSSLVSHTQLITKVYFPREILPITYNISAGFDFLIAALVLVGMMAYQRIHLSIYACWIVPILLVAFLFAIVCSLFLSMLQVWFRDVGLAMPLAMQLWMFASPVVYPLDSVPLRFRKFYVLNPMAGVVENFRRVVVQGKAPDIGSLWAAALVSLFLLPCVYLLFKERESSMADVV
jgi:lipopolysaccharide transport system permease protein